MNDRDVAQSRLPTDVRVAMLNVALSDTWTVDWLTMYCRMKHAASVLARHIHETAEGAS